MKILILEDEESLANSMANYLTGDGYVCETVYNYKTAIAKVDLFEYDCFLVDINLSDGNGLDFIKHLKEKELSGGIIIISARNSLENRIEGLEIGADHYIDKPFHLIELGAYVRSINRRINFEGKNFVVVNEIKLVPDDYTVFVNDNPVDLTRKEFELLQLFFVNKNRVLTKSGIAEYLWGDNIDCSDSFDFIYSHIKNLRKKLMEKGCKNYTQTVHGIGYKFNTDL
ncbi:MAG: response regulator transcription factor [Bacteroidales bacterium]|nr:response regulator transcription factor [Bacteroidales bacterium]